MPSPSLSLSLQTLTPTNDTTHKPHQTHLQNPSLLQLHPQNFPQITPTDPSRQTQNHALLQSPLLPTLRSHSSPNLDPLHDTRLGRPHKRAWNAKEADPLRPREMGSAPELTPPLAPLHVEPVVAGDPIAGAARYCLHLLRGYHHGL